MNTLDQYARAVRSSNLGSKPDTTRSDSDMLGAAGLAAKPVRTRADGTQTTGSPLGVAMARLLAGNDNHATKDVVRILAAKATGKAYRMGDECSQVEAEDLARRVLAWYRLGTCKACGGHGVRRIAGTNRLSAEQCQACGGTGKLQLRKQIPWARIVLVEWMIGEIDRELAYAAPAIKAALAADGA